MNGVNKNTQLDKGRENKIDCYKKWDLFKKKKNQIYHWNISFKEGTIKDRNSVGLREAEDSKKRWQEYRELYKKDHNDPDNHNGV